MITVSNKIALQDAGANEILIEPESGSSDGKYIAISLRKDCEWFILESEGDVKTLVEQLLIVSTKLFGA